MGFTFWNIGKANAEIERLRTELTSRKPSVNFNRKTRQFNIGRANEEIDELRSELTKLGAPEDVVNVPEARNKRGEPIIHLAVPPHKVAELPGKAASKSASKWAHIHSDELRAMLEETLPNGPVQLREHIVAQAKLSAPAPAPTTDYKAVYRAVFGEEATQGKSEFQCRMSLYYNGANIEGMPVDDVKEQFGERKAPHGMERFRRKEFQSRVDAALNKQKRK